MIHTGAGPHPRNFVLVARRSSLVPGCEVLPCSCHDTPDSRLAVFLRDPSARSTDGICSACGPFSGSARQAGNRRRRARPHRTHCPADHGQHRRRARRRLRCRSQAARRDRRTLRACRGRFSSTTSRRCSTRRGRPQWPRFGTTADHPVVVEAAAPRGIHVMMEKPLAVSIADGDRIRRRPRRGKIHVIVNYETTWYPSHAAIWRLMKQRGRPARSARSWRWTATRGRRRSASSPSSSTG